MEKENAGIEQENDKNLKPDRRGKRRQSFIS
jgi:hypothetical protein